MSDFKSLTATPVEGIKSPPSPLLNPKLRHLVWVMKAAHNFKMENRTSIMFSQSLEDISEELDDNLAIQIEESKEEKSIPVEIPVEKDQSTEVSSSIRSSKGIIQLALCPDGSKQENNEISQHKLSKAFSPFIVMGIIKWKRLIKKGSKNVLRIVKPQLVSGLVDYNRVLCQGTFGIVWEAVDEKHGNVAVKIQCPSSRETKNCILQEIDIQEHLTSQTTKVVQLYRKFIGENQISIVMEQMVASLMFFKFPFSQEEVATILLDTMEALATIHREGIAYRDLKPDNLLISKDGVVKICDFGLSCFDGDATGLGGTLVYLSPEVAEEFVLRSDNPKLKASGKEDIWAVGITALELATGKVPFDDQDINVVTKHIYENPAPQISKEEHPNLSDEFVDFVHQCLQKDPKERPTSDHLLKHPFLSSERVELGRESLKKRIESFPDKR
eukprot:TRINITY_DN4725_c0_g1_i1.p1 TRINITY_DN4725_c0_g1~~TRINITY_DN4725_c0_g1_i1.p1  ORF type:complete len:443 (-),score=142.04 TRINITY_DN4725_c0_g1_i1:17-1345(-)